MNETLPLPTDYCWPVDEDTDAAINKEVAQMAAELWFELVDGTIEDLPMLREPSGREKLRAYYDLGPMGWYEYASRYPAMARHDWQEFGQLIRRYPETPGFALQPMFNGTVGNGGRPMQ